MKIYIDGNPVDVEINFDTQTNQLTLASKTWKTPIQIMRIQGHSQGLAAALIDHILTYNLKEESTANSRIKKNNVVKDVE